MFKVVLPVYFHTKESLQKEELGISDATDSKRIDNIIFYDIKAIEQAVDEDTLEPSEGSVIHSNGLVFISPKSVKEVEDLINKAMGLW